MLLGQITAKEIFAQCSPVVVTIKTDQGNGSGFVATDTGLIYTAAHVIEGASEVKVTFSDGVSFESTGIVDADQNADVAVIKARFSGRPMAKIANATPAIGEKVFAIGAPLGLEFSITDGILSQFRNDDGVQLLQYSCGTSPGNSGCPIFNSAGEVIAVHTSKRKGGENTNFGVSISLLKGLDMSLSTTKYVDYKWKKQATGGAPSDGGGSLLSRAAAVDLLYSEIAKSYAAREAVYDLTTEIYTKSPGNAIVSTNIIEGPADLAKIANRISTLSTGFDQELRVEALKFSLNLSDAAEAYGKLMRTFRDAQKRGWESAINRSFNEAFEKMFAPMASDELVAILTKEVPVAKQTLDFKYRFDHSDEVNKIVAGSLVKLGIFTTISDYPYVRVVSFNKDLPAGKAGIQLGDQFVAINGVEVRDPFKTLSELMALPGTQFKIEVRKHGGGNKTYTIKVPK